MSPLPNPPEAGLPSEELHRRARALAWLLFDVDGVMNDGSLYFSSEGERLKTFHVRDGLGIALARRRGLKVGILSGRRSPALERRARDLGLDELIVDEPHKGRAFDAFLARRGVAAERVAYTGDDLLDLPVLLRAGVSFAPADAVPEVRERVHHVLERAGGRGAVREVIELVLRARGEWQEVVSAFLEHPETT